MGIGIFVVWCVALIPALATLRRGWWNDVIYLLINGWLIKLGILIMIAGAIVVSAWLIPPPVQKL